MAMDMVLYLRMSSVRYGRRKSFQIHMVCRMATDTMLGFIIGTTMVKNVRGTEAPSIMAASSISAGSDLITPVNMNTARPAPKPR